MKQTFSDQWSVMLRGVWDELEKNSVLDHIESPLKMKISEVVFGQLLVVRPDTTLKQSLSGFVDADVDFALVQETKHSLEGVLRASSVQSALARPAANSRDKVCHFMERNICIEPDSATTLEVMERMTVGCCPCTVIVDGGRGIPLSLVSPRSMLLILQSALQHNGNSRFLHSDLNVLLAGGIGTQKTSSARRLSH